MKKDKNIWYLRYEGRTLQLIPAPTSNKQTSRCAASSMQTWRGKTWPTPSRVCKDSRSMVITTAAVLLDEYTPPPRSSPGLDGKNTKQ